MKFLKINTEIVGKELLLNDEKTNLVHLHLPKGKETPLHFSKLEVVVIIVKGRVLFGDEQSQTEIVPGNVVVMLPNEKHKLLALEDSDLIVNHMY